jgi:hypothetical protein
MGEVLDRLIEKGYKPALVCHPDGKRWAVPLRHTWALGASTEVPTVVYTGVICDENWQPTRPLAVCAAVLPLMKSEGG